jgi:hypothetical protein
MPAKKVANAEQTEKERAPQWQPDTERYLLQIDTSSMKSCSISVTDHYKQTHKRV